MDALKAITADDIGKEALKAGLKKVVITFDESTAPASNYETGLKLTDGVLTMNFTPWSNEDDLKRRAEAIQKVVEAGL